MEHLAQHLPAGVDDITHHQSNAGLAGYQPHQQHHADQSARDRADGDTGDAKLGQAEPAVEQQQVADEGDEVDDEGHIHRLTGVAVSAQGRRQTEGCRFRQ